MLRSFRPHGVADGLLLGFMRDELAAFIATFAGPGPGVPFQQQGDLCELQCKGVKRMLCLWSGAAWGVRGGGTSGGTVKKKPQMAASY